MNYQWNLQSEFGWPLLVFAALFTAGISFRSSRGTHRPVLYASLLLRFAGLFLLVLAAARPVLTTREIPRLSLDFLLDVSRSVPESEQAGLLETANRIGARLQRGDQARLIAFAREPRIVEVAAGPAHFTLKGYGIDAGRTNLSRALLKTALGQGKAGIHRTVLFSDGNENQERSRSVLPLLRQSGVPIFTFSSENTSSLVRKMARFEKIALPAQVGTDERFYVHVFLDNPGLIPAEGTLRIYFDRALASEQAVVLEPGMTPFRLLYHERRTGIHCVSAELALKVSRKISETRAFVHVVSKPRVLLVDRDFERRKYLAQLLGKDFDVAVRQAVPADYQALIRFECLILDDIPVTLFRRGEMDMIARAVQDAGVGLLVIGGDDENGLSSYRGSRLEQILPVKLDIRTAKKRRDFSLFLLIDRSGSMRGSKIDMAILSALKAIDNLEPGDVISVIAFDVQPEWIVKMEVLEADASEIKQRIKSLGAGGGTDARRAMLAAFKELLSRQMNIRQHVVLISDGLTDEAGFTSLAEQMSQTGITVSTVAIGPEANLPLLKALQKKGRGQFYHVKNLKKLPDIVLEDLRERLKQANIVRSEFRPRLFKPHPVVKGIDAARLPLLRSYCLSKLKPAAEKPLTTNFKNTEDPILATWLYGLGKCSVLLSGLRTGWLGRGTEWPQFGTLWSQLIRWTARSDSAEHPLLKFRIADRRLEFDLRVPVPNGQFPQSIEADVLRPGNSPLAVSLVQKSSYEFAGEIPLSNAPGSLDGTALVLKGKTLDEKWVRAYPIFLPDKLGTNQTAMESAAQPANLTLLKEIAQATGAAFQPPLSRILDRGEKIEVTREQWQWCVWLALSTFLADIAVRRLFV